MKQKFMWFAVACALVCAGSATAAEVVVMDFDSVPWGGGSTGDNLTRENVTDDVAQARGSVTAMKCVFTGGDWSQIQGGLNTEPTDLSGMRELHFWAKADIDGAQVSFNLMEGWGGPSTNYTATLSTEWTKYEVPFTEFSAEINLGNLNIIQLQFFGTDARTVWLDEVFAWKSDDALPPILLSQTPEGIANSIETVNVTFDTEVSGLVAGDLTVDGSAATEVSSEDNITFEFSGFTPATPTSHETYDTVTIELAAGSIVNAADTSQAFAGASWDVDLYIAKEIEVPYVMSAPTIDGVINAGEWPLDMIIDWEGDPEQNADFSSKWTIAHDANNVYLAVEVEDSVFKGGDNRWEGDNVEIFFDWNFDRSTRNQHRIDWSLEEWGNSDTPVTEWQVVDTVDSGYVIEMRFEKQEGTGSLVGFDIASGDADDEVSNVDKQWYWNASPSNGAPWNDPSSYGTLILESLVLEGINSNINPSFISVGDTVVLTTGNGTGYTWYHDGEEIVGETGQTLSLDDIQLTDGGTYRVTFNDGAEDVEYGIYVNVLPSDSVPVTGFLGLGALAAVVSMAGARRLRRKA